MRVPDADRAVIDRQKMVQYLLNLDHPDGGSKAVVFAHAGFTAAKPEELEQALRTQHLPQAAQEGKSSAYGQKYEIVGPLTGPAGRVMVRSIWIIRPGESAPRLITLIPERQQ